MNTVVLRALWASLPEAYVAETPAVVLGVAAPSDPCFKTEKASDSLWRPFDAMFDLHPGIHFLGPHDPCKIPVLFVSRHQRIARKLHVSDRAPRSPAL